jgi:hypothetical protein
MFHCISFSSNLVLVSSNLVLVSYNSSYNYSNLLFHSRAYSKIKDFDFLDDELELDIDYGSERMFFGGGYN